MIKKTLLFVYDFPHAKSVRFLRKLKESDIKIDVIVAASYKTIKKTKRLYDFHKYNSTSVHPKDLAKKYKIPYFNLDHNSIDVEKIIIDNKINFGIIAGARILSQKIIKLFSYGILILDFPFPFPFPFPFLFFLLPYDIGIHSTGNSRVGDHVVTNKSNNTTNV